MTPTIRQIAERCAVSRSTVSLALKRDPRISTRVIDLVSGTAFDMGYVPDPKVAQIMSQIARKEKNARNCLGILFGSSFQGPNPWECHPWLGRFHPALAARAQEYGYSLDTFWLGQSGMSGRRMKQILTARGIEGIITFDHLWAQAEIDFDFSEFASAVIGLGPTRSRLDAVGGNLHDDLVRALHKTMERGYQSPGLALDNVYSSQSLQAWRSSYVYHESVIPEWRRIPICLYGRDDLGPLKEWYEEYQPDAILGLSASTYRDLQRIGLRLPIDVGFVTLLQDERIPQVDGIGLQYKAIASRAVDLVAERLRRFEKGLPAVPELTLFDGTWCDGKTLPAKVSSVSAA